MYLYILFFMMMELRHENIMKSIQFTDQLIFRLFSILVLFVLSNFEF